MNELTIPVEKPEITYQCLMMLTGRNIEIHAAKFLPQSLDDALCEFGRLRRSAPYREIGAFGDIGDTVLFPTYILTVSYLYESIRDVVRYVEALLRDYYDDGFYNKSAR